MPITPSYPGVYVEELSSGVRTIAGVSTSVTVFLGASRRGPINRAVTIRSWADYERRYGGLASESEMGYSVRQFFNNGGGEAIIIRVAANVATAHLPLINGAGTEVLEITAADAGSAGNGVEVQVTHGANPNTFGLVAILNDPANPVQETFDNLSMNSRDPRYVVPIVNSTSTLIQVERKAGIDFSGGTGTATSGVLTQADVDALGATRRNLRLSLNGSEPVNVDLGGTAIPANADLNVRLTEVANRIRNQAIANGSGPAFTGVTVATVGGNRIRITSGQNGEFASARVLPGLSLDAASLLKLGADAGGTDLDGTSTFRPAVTPTRASLTSTGFTGAQLDGLPSGTARNFNLALDGGAPVEIDLLGVAVTGLGTVAEKAQRLADHITTRVRDIGSGPAFDNFTATVDTSGPDPRLVFTGGTAGATSRITVTNGGSNNVLDELHFNDAATDDGSTSKLAGGNDTLFNDGNLQTVFLGSRAQRTGIYALESVDIFNLLCMPGITNGAVLAEAVAYCEERRAFLIADPPAGRSPDQMKTIISGTQYPKNKNGAVYYPLIGISDPLQSGANRYIGPSGTVAGVMARTDATRGVWKAPAGTDAALGGVLKLEYVLTDAENGALNPRAVNCLRLFPNFGAVAWGARTLVGDDDRGDEWKYIPVRRLALYIEESLYRGSKWAVFEPNDEPLWAQLRMNIGAFMHDLFRQGAFAGSSPRDAYLVQCDKTTTTQSDINRGIVNVIVGFAPLKPAEFVFLKIRQLAGQLSA